MSAGFTVGTTGTPGSPNAPRQPWVGIVMGSDSDWPVMQAAADALAEFDVPIE
ncbi:MAG TPA: AIR carboxylase family protein, partial [Cellulomonas sp.]